MPDIKRKNMPQATTTLSIPDNLSKYGMNLLNDAERIAARITFLPLKPTSISDLESYMRGHAISEMIILDQKVLGIEDQATKMDWGYLYKNNGLKISVIDHHVTNPELQKLSTGNLVIRYLQSQPTAQSNVAVCLTHKDCDSLLSALMITGALPPHEQFGIAVLAADHNAQKNPIADLLQAIEDCPKAEQTVSSEQFIYSITALGALLTNRKMDSRATELSNARTQARSAWASKIQDFTRLANGTYYYVCQERVSTDPCPEFVPALLPDAQIILIFHNDPENSQFIQIRAALGQSAKPGVVIDHVDLIKPVVPGFGGRVDAGSNRRSGTSIQDPDSIAAEVDFNLGNILNS